MRRFGRLPFADGDRARHPAGARRVRGRRLPQPLDRAATARGWRCSRPRARASCPTARRPRPARRCASPIWPRRSRRSGTAAPTASTAGRVADLIVAEMERGGGLITHEDLAGYRAIWRDPITISYRGYTIYSMPPASSGGVTMGEILNIMEGYRPAAAVRLARADAPRGGGDAARVHRPQHLAGRPGLRAATRSTGCSRRQYAAELRKRDRRARHADPGVRRRRRAAAPRPPTTRWWTPRATR